MGGDAVYKNAKNDIESIVYSAGDSFTISDTGTSFELIHRWLPIGIELPPSVRRGAMSHVNMMVPLGGEGSFEAMIDQLQRGIKRRDFLRGRGYRKCEKFSEYADGPEMIYDIPTESITALGELCRDFGFVRITHAGIDHIARGRKLVKIAGGKLTILIEATSSIRKYGAETELSLPKCLSKKLGIDPDTDLCVAAKEIGDYGRHFQRYVLALLEKADMYVAEARWHGGVSPEAMDYAQNTGFMRQSLDGELYQEK